MKKNYFSQGNDVVINPLVVEARNIKVSVIIVNWNGKKWLENCFGSLAKQSFRSFDVIFVDNNSSDDSVEYIETNYPAVKVVKEKNNLGFAGGNCSGLKYCSGEYILLLNNDTIMKPNYLENMIAGFERHPEAGSIQSKMILMNEASKLDVCGSYWTSTTFLYHFGYAQDVSASVFNKEMAFFSNKGASMMLRKCAIDEIGFIDSDFWSYYEETDLCHRMWIAGYECWYIPDAEMYHAVGGTSIEMLSSQMQYHNFKNKLLSYLKNFELCTLLKVIPTYLALTIILSFVWLMQGRFGHFASVYKSYGWNVMHLRQTLNKRNIVQKNRKKTDNEIMKVVKRSPPLRYYYCLFVGLEKFNEQTLT